MSKLEEKLREGKNQRARDQLLTVLSPQLYNLLLNAKFSHDVECVKYAAFSTWNIEEGVQTTSRGCIEGWELKRFVTFDEAVNFVKTSVESATIPGWFFIDSDGPYYSLTLSEFVPHIDIIQKFCIEQEHFDIGWAGNSIDMGVIIELNNDSFGHDHFEVCMWGM